MIVKLTKEAEIGNGSISASKKHLNSDCATHWHEFYEIEYVLNGSGECQINNSCFEIKNGMLFFMTPVDFHTVKGADATVINIMFSSEMTTQKNLLPFTNLVAPKAIEITSENCGFIETVLEEVIENKNNPQYCSALIDVLLLKLTERLNVVTQDKEYNHSQKMTFYIINHFREKIGLNDVAAAVGITPNYASAVFKEEMQINIKKYLDDMRFDYAKKLLIYSDLTVQQICNDSGFEDCPNFIRRFKAKFGMPPIEFRKAQKTLEKK